MRFVFRLIPLVFVLCHPLYSAAQDASNEAGKNAKLAVSVAVQPLYAISNAGKFDIELQNSASRFAYIISPEIYGGSLRDVSPFQNQVGVNKDRLSGFGIGLLQKYYVNESKRPYVAYGLTYRYQTIAFEAEGYDTFEKNGLTYYQYGPIKDKWKINSFLISTVIGYQKIKHDFLYDVYLGFGYKKPSVESKYPEARKYDEGVYNFAYTGLVYHMGFKIGFNIR